MLVDNSAEELLNVAFRVEGEEIPLNKFIVDQDVATQVLEEGLDKAVIVYGAIDKVVKREKVMYVNFDEQDGKESSSLVIFSNDFSRLNFVNDQIEGKTILAYGQLSSKYKGQSGAQMIIRNEKHLYIC